ncbi:tetratricopeptide repeat protein [Luteolibacter sp. Populi]|uniref:tetratricopeptide repeat protein n=1 Tax=Luteolibacter sp. Populi TaxID=3230487 RepID=UPI003466A73C
MRVAKTYIPRHVLGALLLASMAAPVIAQEPAPKPPGPAPAPATPAAPATLNKLFDEAEKAFGAQDYANAVTKLQELLKALGNRQDAPLEMLNFNVGLAHLLGGNAADAEKAFDDCAKKFPKGEYTSRCWLGVGRAAILQGGEEKQKVAIDALKKAAADPKFRTEAGLSLGQVYLETNQTDAALTVFRSLMGSDVRTPQQTAAAVEVIGLLASTDQMDELVHYLDRLLGQVGIREAIAWYSNQVVVKGDEMVQGEKYEAALAIYRSIPPRAQILAIQAASLESMRKERELLDKRRLAEEKLPLGQRSNVSELLNMADASLKLNDEAKKAIEGIADFDAALLMRRGRCYYYMDRFEEGLLCFGTIREKHPNATDAQAAAYAEIVIYNMLKDNTKIQALTEQFLTKYPTAPNLEQVSTLAGEVLVQTGDWVKVANFYADLATKFPQSPNIDRFHFYQGVAKFQQGEFLPSAEMFEKFMKDYPNSGMKENAMYRIAMGYFFSNKYKETLQWCREYLKTYPDGQFAGDMYYRLAFIDSNDKEADQSKNIIDSLTGYLAKKPDDLAAGSMLSLVADTWKKRMTPREGEKPKTPEEIKNFEDEALKTYIKAVWSKSPDDVIQYAMDEATTILQGRKDWQGIADLQGRFLKEKPDHQMAMMAANWVSKAMSRLGKPEEGAQVLADVMAKNIGDPSKEQVEYLISEIAKSLVPRGKRTPEMNKEIDDKLVAMLNKAAEGKESATTAARIVYGRAQLATIMRDPKAAETYLSALAADETVKADDLSPALLTACAEILLKTGDLDRAEAMFRRLADKYADSSFSDAGPVGLGQVALARKEPQKAFEIFEHTLNNVAGMSRFKEATFGKLQALYDLEKWDDTEAFAMKIVGDSKSFRGRTIPKSYMILAQVLRQKAKNQDTRGSIETLKKAHGYYQKVYTAYKKEIDICADAYLAAYDTLKELGSTKLAQDTLAAMIAEPKLKDTEQVKKAKQLLGANSSPEQ